jgi:hypothetical protein
MKLTISTVEKTLTVNDEELSGLFTEWQAAPERSSREDAAWERVEERAAVLAEVEESNTDYVVDVIPVWAESDATKHPQTDEHLAGCGPCMMAHDKAQPDEVVPRITTMAELLRETAKQVGFLPADAQGFVRIPDPGTLPHLFPNVKLVAADLVEAAAGDTCKGCGRDSIACSVDPCAAVIADRSEGLPPDPEGTNDESAKQAKDTLIHFEEAHGEAPYGGISEAQLLDLHRQNIVDLLANLGHFCDREGLDMQDILRSAANHYDAETGGEGSQFTAVN